MFKKTKRFIGEKISTLMHEGYPQKQAIAIAFSMARKAGYKTNPGAAWHEEFARAYGEIADITPEYKKHGYSYTRDFYKGAEHAHRASTAMSKRMGINPKNKSNEMFTLRQVKERNDIQNNPPDAVEIYDTILSIEAQKGKKSLWPNQNFRHKFSKKSKAAIYGLKDGSILIKSQVGKPLWKVFDYSSDDIDKGE